MRTTVNIDPQLLAGAKNVATRTHRSLSSVINDALRILLRTRPEDFSLPTDGRYGLRAGLELDDKEPLAELPGDNNPPFR